MKPRKHRVIHLEKTFIEKLTLVQQSHRVNVSANGFSKRHAQTLASLCDKPWPHPVPEGQLILVMDALWFMLDERQFTVYLMGFRKVNEDTLRFLPPVLRPGHESQKEWREIICVIPEDVRKRICAVVSDVSNGS